MSADGLQSTVNLRLKYWLSSGCLIVLASFLAYPRSHACTRDHVTFSVFPPVPRDIAQGQPKAGAAAFLIYFGELLIF